MKITRSLLEEVMDEIGSELDLRESYVGRGPSQPGIGLTGNEHDLLLFFIELASRDKAMARELAYSVRQDSMGLATIYYFPGITLTDSEE